MALPVFYATGTASVANGSASVTGTGTLWGDDAIMAGDLFADLAQPLVPPQRIASVEGDGALTLAAPWPGTALVAAAYEIRYVGIIERSTAQTRLVLEQLGEVNANYDIQVNDTAARLALESVDTPLRANYRVLVSNIGDGTAAIYSKASSAYNDWTDPAYVTGPTVTLDIAEVDEVPYGTPPDVTLTPIAGGYDLAFDIPAGMIIEPGTTTTLAPDQDAAVDFVPVTGGYRLDISIPRGPTGDITGVTPFWNMRLGSDADAASARNGLAVPSLVQSGIVSLPTDGSSDVLADLVAAQASQDGIRVPSGTYFLSEVLDILDGRSWWFDNVTLIHSDETQGLLRAVGKVDWAIGGKLTLVGLKTGAETASETGLLVDDCLNFSVSDVVGRNFRGKAFDMLGTGLNAYDREKGRLRNLLARGSTIGFDLQAGTRAEYAMLSDCSAVENETGVRKATGNVVWTGGYITANGIGIDLRAGTNHLHGTFNGTLINHNGKNVVGTDVQAGELFANCHIYEGDIELTGCKDIVFNGGVMDVANFKNDIGSAGGFSYVTGMNFTGAAEIAATGDAPGKVRFFRNFGVGISRDLNGPAEHYSTVYQSGEVALPDGTQDDVIFSVALQDTNSNYNTTNGIFTAPVSGLYRITVNALFNASAIIEAESYLDLQTNVGAGQPFASATLMLPTRYGDAKLRFNEAADLGLTAGHQFRILANIVGTTPKFGDSTWLSLMNVEKIG